MKWTKKLFFHLLDLSVTNGYILFCKNSGSIQHNDFQKELCTQIIECALEEPDFPRPQKAGRPYAGNIERLSFKYSEHWPVNIPPTEKKSQPRRECVVCRAKRPKTGKRWQKGEPSFRVETKYECEGCPDRPALCVSPCFKLYHKKKDYSSWPNVANCNW